MRKAEEAAENLVAKAQQKHTTLTVRSEAGIDAVVASVNARRAASSSASASARAPQPLSRYRALASATLADFAKMKVKQLQAFIHSRMYSSSKAPKKAPYTQLNKLKLVDAQAGTPCLILSAFELRRRKSLLPVAIAAAPPPAPRPPVGMVALILSQSSHVDGQPSASAMMNDAPWISRTLAAVSGGSGAWVADGARADALTPLLRARLHEHIRTRVTDEGKWSHWVWEFVYGNLSRLAALITGFGQASPNFDFASESSSLLPPSSAAFRTITLGSAEAKKEGAYIIFEPKIRGRFVRSGSCVGEFLSFSFLLPLIRVQLTLPNPPTPLLPPTLARTSQVRLPTLRRA